MKLSELQINEIANQIVYDRDEDKFVQVAELKVGKRKVIEFVCDAKFVTQKNRFGKVKTIGAMVTKVECNDAKVENLDELLNEIKAQVDAEWGALIEDASEIEDRKVLIRAWNE